MTEQEYLIQQINLIRLEYEKMAKLYIDRLVYLKSIEQPSIFFIPEQVEAIRARGQA